MKKYFAVIGVLVAFGVGLKLYNNAHEIKTAVQPQQEVAEVTAPASDVAEVNVAREVKVVAQPQPEAVEAATPANNSTEVVTLEGKAKVTFPDRQ